MMDQYLVKYQFYIFLFFKLIFLENIPPKDGVLFAIEKNIFQKSYFLQLYCLSLTFKNKPPEKTAAIFLLKYFFLILFKKRIIFSIMICSKFGLSNIFGKYPTHILDTFVIELLVKIYVLNNHLC